MTCPLVSFEVSMDWVTLRSLHFNAQGYVPVLWRIRVVCLALGFVGSWVELGFSVGKEAFD